ncbi:MAG: Ig-like domain-containing protein [Candidatus Acidiferrales bacterium]
MTSISVTPTGISVPPGTNQQFTATGRFSDGSTQDLTNSVVWTSLNTSAATISSSGMATGVAIGIAAMQASQSGVTGATNFTVNATQAAETVLTYHNDLARTGQDLTETKLTLANANVNSFGKVFTVAVDGAIYAQPLYVPRVGVAGHGTHNVVYAGTENDTMFAFDADASGAALWTTSLLGAGESAVTPNEVFGCGDLAPLIGITGTPVIDPQTDILFVVAKSKKGSGNGATIFQRLYALDISSGKELAGSPVEITATVPGTGEGGNNVTFNAQSQQNRAALALVNGVVYASFGSHCDQGTYHGWLFAFDAATLAQRAVLNVSPNGSEAAIWQAGAAPSADANNNIFAVTGNGTFDANIGGPDYGDSMVKLTLSGSALPVNDFFTPFNQQALNDQDQDLGSAAAVLLPDSTGNGQHRHLLVGGGKGGTLYLVDRDNMGKFSAIVDSSIQSIPGAIGNNGGGAQSYSTAAYFNGALYFAGVHDTLKQFSIANATISTQPIFQSSTVFGFPGATSSISADGTSNGIVWTTEFTGGAAILHAYNAGDVSLELYNTNQAPGNRDLAHVSVKFSVPTVANGKVYIGTQDHLDVFGLLH